jgi:hypothetical protein
MSGVEVRADIVYLSRQESDKLPTKMYRQIDRGHLKKGIF